MHHRSAGCFMRSGPVINKGETQETDLDSNGTPVTWWNIVKET
jgi:hypothetical protein